MNQEESSKYCSTDANQSFLPSDNDSISFISPNQTGNQLLLELYSSTPSADLQNPSFRVQVSPIISFDSTDGSSKYIPLPGSSERDDSPSSSSSSCFSRNDNGLRDGVRNSALNKSPNSLINRRLYRVQCNDNETEAVRSLCKRALEEVSGARQSPFKQFQNARIDDLSSQYQWEQGGILDKDGPHCANDSVKTIFSESSYTNPLAKTPPKKLTTHEKSTRFQLEFKGLVSNHQFYHTQSSKLIRPGSTRHETGNVDKKKGSYYFNPWSERLRKANQEQVFSNLRHQQRRQRLRKLLLHGTCLALLTTFIFSFNIFCFLEHQNVHHQENYFERNKNLSQVILDSPEKDTLYIYRIIGNDLPPRHSPDQTLRNLKFLLKNEDGFDGLASILPGKSTLKLRLKKFYVLNRIANITQLAQVTNLLLNHGISSDNIIIDRFDFDEYRAQPFSWSPAVVGNPVWGFENDQPSLNLIEDNNNKTLGLRSLISQNSKKDELAGDDSINLTISKLRALDFTYHDKNIYAMNNNGGRNFALEHGRAQPDARWILPLDGNSFFTPAAMISLIESLRNSESQPNPPSHVIIPMSRLLDNNEALNQNQPIEEANYSVKRLKLNNLRPKSPEEPQIGFRFSSQENFSNQMRYGRRSKLELLWRLGAIEKTRNFDKRFSEWEQAEKNLLRPEFYGSIKRVSSICSFMSGLSREKRVKEDVNDENRSKVHPRMRRGLAFLNPKNKPTGECFQAIVQEDFLRAGWILRLFSGDQSQEVHSSSALVRRSINRMKGIVLFLENLDEIVARGGMLKSRSQVSFGFDSSRLWTLNGSELFKLKKIMKYNYLDREEADIHKTLEQQKLLWEAHLNFANLVSAGESSALEKSEELDEVSKTIFLLAMADFLTGEHSFGDSAIRLVKLKFLDFQHFSLTSNMFPLADWRKELEIIRAKDDYDGAGYAFPIPKNAGNLPKWFEDPKTEALPFDPKTFDPALLFDGLRLLSSHWRVKESSTSEELPLGELKELFKIQTGFLLLDEKAFKKMYSTNTKCKSDILRYDIKLSALASFVDDARLLGRIANRSLVRLPLLFQLSKSKSKSCPKDEKIMIDLCQNFKAGLKNIKFHPFDEENHKLGLLCKELGVQRSTN